MPPKRKSEADNRSPVEIELERVTDEIKQCEQQVANYRDALNDITVHTAKAKQLETDLAPRETEHKAVLAAFSRLVDSQSTILKKPKQDENADEEPQQRSRTPAVSRLSTRSGQSAVESQIADENADREALKQLSQAIREVVYNIVAPIFTTGPTTAEVAAQEVAAATKDDVPAPKPLPKGAGKDVQKPPPKLDMELVCPPGIEYSFFQDVLKLRLQRVHLEKVMTALNQQLTGSRQILRKRHEEGVSKSLLKKSEKQLQQLQKAQRELAKRKDEEDIVRRRTELNSAMGSRDKKKKSIVPPAA